MNLTKALQEKPFDADEWQKLYYRHQQQYMRNRLDGSSVRKIARNPYQI